MSGAAPKSRGRSQRLRRRMAEGSAEGAASEAASAVKETVGEAPSPAGPATRTPGAEVAPPAAEPPAIRAQRDAGRESQSVAEREGVKNFLQSSEPAATRQAGADDDLSQDSSTQQTSPADGPDTEPAAGGNRNQPAEKPRPATEDQEASDRPCPRRRVRKRPPSPPLPQRLSTSRRSDSRDSRRRSDSRDSRDSRAAMSSRPGPSNPPRTRSRPNDAPSWQVEGRYPSRSPPPPPHQQRRGHWEWWPDQDRWQDNNRRPWSDRGKGRARKGKGEAEGKGKADDDDDDDEQAESAANATVRCPICKKIVKGGVCALRAHQAMSSRCLAVQHPERYALEPCPRCGKMLAAGDAWSRQQHSWYCAPRRRR